MSETGLSLATIKSRRILYLVFATATLLVLGLIYAWSIFARPIGAQFGDYKPMLLVVFQVSMFAFCVSALFGAQLIKATSARLTIIVAAVLLGAGFVLSALFADRSIWMLIIFYGIIAGSGCGIAYNAIISLVNPWFPDRIGLCSGVQMMGFGISSLVLGSLANFMFDFVGDWVPVFIAIAVLGVAIMVAFAIVVKPAPADTAQVLGLTSASAAAKQSPTKNKGILGTKVFWLYSIWATFVIACGLTLIGSSAQGAASVGVDVAIGPLIVGLVSTMNGIGRVINGAIFDKLGLVPVMTISAATALLAMIGLAYSLFATLPVLYIVAAILVALPYGSVPVMAAAYARQRYKANDFAKNLGIANCNIASAAAINIVIVSFLGNPQDANGPVIYGILAVLAVIALVFVFIFAKAYKADLKQIDGELAEPAGLPEG